MISVEKKSFVSFTRDKKIYDAVHGFIRFNAIECQLINSEPFQRLHGLHQLGIAYHVYPGATHTRFEHSLGTMELATRIFERISSKCLVEEPEYWLQVIRLAALCHDLGHLPFSHDAEHAILDEGGHEKWTLAIIQSDLLAPVWEPLCALFPKKDIVSDLLKMAIGENKLLEMGPKHTQNLGICQEGSPDFLASTSCSVNIAGGYTFTPLERVLCQVITGDFFGADRMDYLLRDAQCTGVSYGLFDHHQMIEMLSVIPNESGELSLGIEEDGIASCEALLLARHFMHQRVYQYSSVKAYRFHLARFLKAFFARGDYLNNLESYLSLSDHEILTALRSAAKDFAHPGHFDAIAILRREKRFKAISVSEEVSSGQIDEILKELQIPNDAYHIEPAAHKKPTYALDFSVLTRAGAVALANHFSQILIASKVNSWVYLSPEWERDFRQRIGKIS